MEDDPDELEEQDDEDEEQRIVARTKLWELGPATPIERVLRLLRLDPLVVLVQRPRIRRRRPR